MVVPIPQAFIVKESMEVLIVRMVLNVEVTHGSNKGPYYVDCTSRNMVLAVHTMERCKLIVIEHVVVHELDRTPELQSLNSKVVR